MENTITTGRSRGCKIFRKIYSVICAMVVMLNTFVLSASAFGDNVTIDTNKTSQANADTLMADIIGILLTISRYVGLALIIYGVYEIVMSFMQNQPEAKTKGIVMALAGVVLVGLKSVLKFAGVA